MRFSGVTSAFTALSGYSLLLLLCSGAVVSARPANSIDVVALQSRMSLRASIEAVGPSCTSETLRTRWSTFDPPVPKYVANVQTEQDVATVVAYCVAQDIPFLAQNGGSGWATTFNLGPTGVIINMAALDQFTLSSNKRSATIGGGSLINQTIDAAYAAEVFVETGNCNCVGTLGAILGGGYGNLMGLYGLGVDNVESLNVVLADGKLHAVTAESNPDLFWALRGAGPNFGIVTSATVKAYPVLKASATAWTGGVIFTEDKIEVVVSYINDLILQPEMNVFMYFTSAGPPANTPVVVVTPFLLRGTNITGHQMFAGLYAIGPIADATNVVPYNMFNTGSEGTCVRGARKPSYGVGFNSMIPSTWRKVWNLYTAFQSQPGAENSVVLLERYSLAKMRSVPSSSSAFPNRFVNFNAVAVPWYTNSSLDQSAQLFGSHAREAFRATDGYSHNATYINFAHGDEDPSVVYGASLPRLQALKKLYDPHDVFDQWFNIPT